MIQYQDLYGYIQHKNKWNWSQNSYCPDIDFVIRSNINLDCIDYILFNLVLFDVNEKFNKNILNLPLWCLKWWVQQGTSWYSLQFP